MLRVPPDFCVCFDPISSTADERLAIQCKYCLKAMTIGHWSICNWSLHCKHLKNRFKWMFWVIFWWYDTFVNWILSAAWTLIELVGRNNNRWCKRYKYLKIRPQNQQCGGKGKYSKPKPAKYWAAIFGEHLNWDKYCAIFGKLLNWGLAASQPPWNRPGMTAVFFADRATHVVLSYQWRLFWPQCKCLYVSVEVQFNVEIQCRI